MHWSIWPVRVLKSSVAQIEIHRDFYLDVYTIFKSDLINNMDHMRISGTKPSSVILSQIK